MNMSSNSPIKINQSTTTLAMSTEWTPHIDSCPTSPITPTSPSSPVHFSYKKVPHVYSVEDVMIKRGYIPLKHIAFTLQGSVWKVKSTKSTSSSIIKVAKKALHKKNVAVINGNEIPVHEDIIKETAVLRYLSSSNPPKSLAKFESFFSDKKNYFLITEFGGTNLFHFVKKGHKFLADGKLTIQEWQRFCKLAFIQMIELMDWMHNQMTCCHLDISLENFVIDTVMVTVDHQNCIRFADDFVIKIVDFGLAEVFTAKNVNGDVDFLCTKYVGKTQYKAPKVYDKRIFDARAADVWSLGVVLFMMLIGVAPYQRPSKKEESFKYIITRNITKLLGAWGRLQYVTVPIVDLMQRILVKEKYRLNIKDIKNHPWFL